MSYWPWLLGLSLLVALLERCFPERPQQPVLRRQLGNDLFYLAFNGHFYGLLTAGLVGSLALATADLLDSILPLPGPGEGLGRLPFAAQLVVFLLVSDFLQWCVHNLLHRVPWLWQFHKVHHSVREMDWIASFRFHWMEIVVYRTLLYVPLLWLGGDGRALFAVAVFGTFWGHLNHSNLRLELGPLGYLFNSPRMHLWHHDVSPEGGAAGKNFGIVLSLWDFLFGTAHWPRDRVPERIGYAGDGEMPAGRPAQLTWPLSRLRRGTSR